MQTLLQDLRFAARQLRKNLGFAVTTILTLALGIGATTAIFSLVNAVLLRPLPFPEQDRLVWVNNTREPRQGQKLFHGVVPNVLSYPDYFDLRKQNHSLAYMSSYHDADVTLMGRGEAQHLSSFVVGSDFFRAIGVHPEFGRDFLPDDEKKGSHVVMLSHSLWRDTFASDKNIVGSTITIGGLGYTVAGVMPAGFAFPIQTPVPQLWTTVADDAIDTSGGTPMTEERGAHWLDVVGRLKPGVSIEQAQADLSVISHNLAAQYVKTNKHMDGAIVLTEHEHLVGHSSEALRMLFAAVSFVLLIACANVAGLLLARASRRRPEIAVRSALGASRTQIIRQVLVESVYLAIWGGVTGVFLSVLLVRVLLRFVPESLPRMNEVGVDWKVLAFATGVSVVTGLLFGIFPALRISRLDPSTALREGTRTTSSGRQQHQLHSGLVVAETAIGLILLVGSGLLIRSFVRVIHVDPGFDTSHVLIANIELPDNRYPGDKNVQFYNQLLPRVAQIPGVKSVAASSPLPLTGSMMRITFQIEGRPVPEEDEPSEIVSIATPGFFKTIGIPILRGREFQETDTRSATKVALITQGFARKYFPNDDPIGKHFKPGLGDGYTDSTMREIVGVVGDIKRQRLTADSTPEYYLPLSQATVFSPSLVIRTFGDPDRRDHRGSMPRSRRSTRTSRSLAFTAMTTWFRATLPSHGSNQCC